MLTRDVVVGSRYRSLEGGGEIWAGFLFALSLSVSRFPFFFKCVYSCWGVENNLVFLFFVLIYKILPT